VKQLFCFGLKSASFGLRLIGCLRHGVTSVCLIKSVIA
jgi:hypothetical protein